MVKKNFMLLVFLLLALFPFVVFGQEYLAPSSPAYMIEQEWKDIVDAQRSRDLQRIHQSVQELRELAIIEGIWSYDEYSKSLLLYSEEAYASGDMESASFYARKAIELSPLSVPVRFAALGQLHKLGISSFGSELWFIANHVWQFPYTILTIGSSLIYPVLLAFTFSLLLVLLFFLFLNSQPLLRFVAGKLPFALRGITTPVITLAVFIAPLYYGPLWTLVCWALLVWLCIEKSKHIVIASGVCVALWGFLIPIRENVQVWLSDPGVKVMLKVQRGDYVPDGFRVLTHLATRRASDPVVHYVLAMAERRLEKYDDALERLERIEYQLGQDSRVAGQRAMISFLKKDFQGALEYYKEARDAGYESAELLFNYSKAAFEVLDTELSRELSSLARGKNTELVEELTRRESKIGISAPGTLAELSLPESVFFESAMLPLPAGAERIKNTARVLLPGVPAPFLSIVGIVIFVLGLIGRRIQRGRFESHYYENYRRPMLLSLFLLVIPTGPWIQAGRYVRAVCLLAIAFFLVFPLIGWPYDVASLFVTAPWLPTLLLYIALIYVLIIYYLGFFVEEEE